MINNRYNIICIKIKFNFIWYSRLQGQSKIIITTIEFNFIANNNYLLTYQNIHNNTITFMVYNI